LKKAQTFKRFTKSFMGF